MVRLQVVFGSGRNLITVRQATKLARG